jgi:hypothetical protein
MTSGREPISLLRARRNRRADCPHKTLSYVAVSFLISGSDSGLILLANSNRFILGCFNLADMCLLPQTSFVIPEQTERVACAAFPKGSLCLRIAAELGRIFSDEQFAELFP